MNRAWVCWVAGFGLAGCRERSFPAARESPTNPADSAYAVAPADTTYSDPARHSIGFARNGSVRIHYLDFGGKGEPLVLVTGLGSSAHIFDDFAPRFTNHFRVVAVTRRGHAESDHPTSGYALDTLVADLKAVLDTLGLGKFNLAGHSIAGGEITRFAIRYPERVARLIYIDAMLQPAGLEQVIAEDTIKVKATAADLATYEAARSWFQRCIYGFWSPALETDFRINTTTSVTTDAIFHEAVRNPAWRQDYSSIRAPVLVLYTLSTLQQRRPCLATSPDRGRARRAELFIERRWRPYQQVGVDLLKRELPDAWVIQLHGHHFLFISNADEVVREMQKFLGAGTPGN